MIAASLAACSGSSNAGGGDDTSGPMDAAPDADPDPIPEDAIYLDPVAGQAAAPGTADAPWPGLADSIAAGLLATVADGKTLVLRDGEHGNAVFEGDHAVAITIRAAPGASPRLGRLLLRKGSGWHLRGLTISPAFSATCREVVVAVQRLTGFDRVMLYRFDEQGHGSVDAEALRPGLEPYLGLHYPASDIPKQARELYEKNWIRIIPDATYAPMPIVPALRPDTGTPLDLSSAILRSVSPIHLEYLANMDIRASLSVSLVVRDRLWGLVSCAHHAGPQYVPPAIRTSCEVIGRLLSLQLAALEARELADRRAARQQLVARLVAPPHAVEPGAAQLIEDVLPRLLARPADLLAFVNATGAALAGLGELRTCGQTPPPSTIAAIVRWLDDHVADVRVATSHLAAEVPSARGVSDVASGLLAVTLPGQPRRRVLWFRPEAVQTVDWGGDPNKPAEPDRDRLHPRRSFALWREVLRERSRSWTAADLEAADELRRSLVEQDLEVQVSRARKAIGARDDMVAVVSHDLRTPMGVIAIVSDTLRAESDPRLAIAADRIDRALARMTMLVEEVLDAASLEAGHLGVHRERTSSRSLIDDAIEIMGPLAEAKQIALEVVVRDTVDLHVDRGRIFQVIANLISNAIKFTPGGGEIRFFVERRGDVLVFEVADTGPGIAMERLPYVFDRYWQAPGAPRKGVGLGLYIAKGIIEAHGGRLSVASVPGRGAVFTFTLPIEAADRLAPPPLHA